MKRMVLIVVILAGLGASVVQAGQGEARIWLDSFVAAIPKPGSDLRFYIASEPKVRAVILWDKDGRLVFPDPNALGLPSDRGTMAQARVLIGHRGAGFMKAPMDPDTAYYCPADHLLCLILDVGAMRQEFGSDWTGTAAMHWFARPALIAGAILMLIAAIFLPSRRHRSPAPVTQDVAIPKDAVQFGDFVVLPARLSARYPDGREVPLTARDIAILKCLADRRGEVIAKDALYDAGWGREYMPNSRALDQHMLTLRRKLGKPSMIETVHGQGYRLRD